MGRPGTSIAGAARSVAQQLPADGSVMHGDRPAPGDVGRLDRGARGAVIIPAHNEAGVIARTLGHLAPLNRIDGVEVIVACNGCSDDTAAIARGFAGVRVVETEKGSKPVGLNLGDAAATAWPRLYLDADIEIAPATVLSVFRALAGPGVRAARPRYVYDTTGASRAVRAYYRARSRLPAPPTRLWGAGGYATNEAGHERFGRFPAVTADDSWFDGQFGDAEKTVVVAPPMRVRTPRDTRDLLAVLTRQRRGYVELGIASHTGVRGHALLSSVTGPGSAWDAAWYAVLTALSRQRARAVLRREGAREWERDASSRRTVEEAR